MPTKAGQGYVFDLRLHGPPLGDSAIVGVERGRPPCSWDDGEMRCPLAVRSTLPGLSPLIALEGLSSVPGRSPPPARRRSILGDRSLLRPPLLRPLALAGRSPPPLNPDGVGQSTALTAVACVTEPGRTIPFPCGERECSFGSAGCDCGGV